MSTKFKRTGLADNTYDILTIVRLVDGSEYHSATLDRESPYVVEICTVRSTESAFDCLCDLDGLELCRQKGAYKAAEHVPEDVVAAVEEGLARGPGTIERVRVGVGVDTWEAFKQYRALGGRVQGFKRVLAYARQERALLEECPSLVAFKENLLKGPAEHSFDWRGFQVQVRMEPDLVLDTSWIGEYCPWPPVKITLQVKEGVIFRSWDRVLAAKVTSTQKVYFVPAIPAAEHARDLSRMGYSRGEAMRLGLQYVHEAKVRMQRYRDGALGMFGLSVHLHREGVLLAQESIWSLESDAGDGLFCELLELLETAHESAVDVLQRLCDTNKYPPHTEKGRYV